MTHNLGIIAGFWNAQLLKTFAAFTKKKEKRKEKEKK